MLAILIVGIGLRVAWVWRPLDHRIKAPWRQSDYTQIARNFAREDPDLFRPRIDWRRDGPGFVEMEFPLLPWIAGMLNRLLGYREEYLRVLSCLLEVGGLLIFAGLARRLLSAGAALAAVALYAINPLLVYLSTAMQPEPLMLFLSLAAMTLLARYDEGGGERSLLLAGAALGGAILAKATAACLGLVFAFVVLRRLGRRAAASPAVWGAAAMALLPAIAWYHHARGLFLIYGNSLGLSNEYPFIGADMLRRPGWILGLLKLETLGVLTPPGWLLLAAALVRPSRALLLPLAWLGSIWVFYVAAARTTADDWAFYYHAAAVAPSCLLMAAGFDALRSPVAALPSRGTPGRWRAAGAATLLVCTLVALAAATAFMVHGRDTHADLRAMRDCGLEFATRIPSAGLIVARGGAVTDPDGFPTAHNQSMLFAWLDRRGFNYGNEEMSPDLLASIARRGGRYWIAEADELAGPRGEAIARRFRLLASCPPGYYLYDLSSAPDDPTP
jgi:4-amino-4-deoxy-L-arabinose transferase-like glycosyltransferase